MTRGEERRGNKGPKLQFKLGSVLPASISSGKDQRVFKGAYE